VAAAFLPAAFRWVEVWVAILCQSLSYGTSILLVLTSIELYH